MKGEQEVANKRKKKKKKPLKMLSVCVRVYVCMCDLYTCTFSSSTRKQKYFCSNTPHYLFMCLRGFQSMAKIQGMVKRKCL